MKSFRNFGKRFNFGYCGKYDYRDCLIDVIHISSDISRDGMSAEISADELSSEISASLVFSDRRSYFN